MEELATIKLEQGRLPLAKLETLPYFVRSILYRISNTCVNCYCQTGFVKESLRFMPLVPGRLPRQVPKGGLYVPAIDDTIPEGSVVGMSHMAIHFNEEIFEKPYEFLPARWIGDSGKELNHWLLSFSKGRTDCIGKT